MAVDYHEYIKTEEWRARAEAAKQRVGQRCQICNRAAPRVTLDVHHRTFERLGNERPEDLTVLCRGCHELYEKNRRIPSPPPPQAAPQNIKTEITAQPSQQQATVNHVEPRRPFAPAKENPQRSPLAVSKVPVGLPLEVDSRYELAPESQPSSSASLYHLTTEDERQPTAGTGENSCHPHRRQQIGIAILIAITLLLVAGLYDIVTLTPGMLLEPLPATTQQPSATSTLASTTAPVIATSLPTPTLAQIVTPTVIPTVIPTLAPTLLPAATPLPPTPTSIPPTVAPTPQSSVVRTGLVCGNPCSCSPVVRTIAQGTPVTVLNTQLCGGDTWYQIGENEWLGPGLITIK